MQKRRVPARQPQGTVGDEQRRLVPPEREAGEDEEGEQQDDAEHLRLAA